MHGKQKTIQKRAAGEKRNVSVELLLSAACFLLILHAIGGWVMQSQPAERQGISGLLWRAVGACSLALFLMCGGAKLLPKDGQPPLKTLYARMVPRLLAALLFWALLYQCLGVLETGRFSVTDFLTACKNVLIFRHDACLSYLQIAILCLLVLPATGLIAANASRGRLRCLLAVWLLLGSILPCVRPLLPFLIEGVPEQALLNPAYASVGMMLAGFYAARYPLKPLRGLLLAAAAAAGTVLLVRVLQARRMVFDSLLAETSPLVLLTTFGLFSAAQGLTDECLPLHGRGLRTTARLSLGIYLASFAVLRFALRLRPLFPPLILSIPLLALAVFAASFCVSGLLALAAALCKRLYAASRRRRLTALWFLIPLLLIAAFAGIVLFRSLRLKDPNPARTESERTVELREGSMTVCQSVQTRGTAVQRRRSYALTNGDTVVCGRLETGDTACEETVVERVLLKTGEGDVTWYNETTDLWDTAPFGEREIRSNCVLVNTAETDLYVWTPIGYELLENNCLRDGGGTGRVELERCDGGWWVTVYSDGLEPEKAGDYVIVRSDAPGMLLELDYKMLRTIWKNYTQKKDNRWCFDGYYFPAPANFVPTDCLFRSPAAYLVNSMVSLQTECRAADDLSLMMLDTMSLQQNEAGYVPTVPASTWLQREYGLDTNYFDTRFNSDLLMLFCNSHENHGGFEPFLQGWFDWFYRFAETRHYETKSGGWLVCDYADASLQTPLTHSSLNHQLAELLVLYRMEAFMDDARIPELTDRMLRALEDCGTAWLRPDGNLHYAYYPDGSFGGDDYPNLTYNDLYNLQAWLRANGRQQSEVFRVLMASKRKWMDENGITGYKTD